MWRADNVSKVALENAKFETTFTLLEAYLEAILTTHPFPKCANSLMMTSVLLVLVTRSNDKYVSSTPVGRAIFLDSPRWGLQGHIMHGAVGSILRAAS